MSAAAEAKALGQRTRVERELREWVMDNEVIGPATGQMLTAVWLRRPYETRESMALVDAKAYAARCGVAPKPEAVLDAARAIVREFRAYEQGRPPGHPVSDEFTVPGTTRCEDNAVSVRVKLLRALCVAVEGGVK